MSDTPANVSRSALGRTLAHNSAANFVSQLIVMGLTFLATPYIIHHFGARAYGTLTVLLTFVSMLSLFQLGINTSLVTFLAEMIARRAYAQANLYVGTSLALFLLIGTVSGVGLATFAPWWVDSVFHVDADLRASALTGFYLATGAFWLRFVADAYSAVPIAAQRFDLVNYVFVGSEIIRILGSVGAVFFGFLIPGVCSVIVFANLFFLLANVFVSRQLLPGVPVKPFVVRPVLSRLLHFSKFVLIGSISGRAVHSVDNLLVGYFLPARYVTFYSVPYTLTQKLWTVVGNITTAVYPAGCALSAHEKTDQFRDLYLRSSRIVAGLAGATAFAFFVMSDRILFYWVGREFADEGSPTMRLLCIGFLLNVLAHIPFSLAQARNRPDIAAKFSAANALLSVPLFYLLIPRFGILGAAVAFTATQALLTPLFVSRVNRLVGADWRTLIHDSYAKPFLAWAVSGLTFLLLRPFALSLTSLLLVCGAGGLCSLVFVWTIVLDRKEREPFSKILLAWRRVSDVHV
jgi:O-antigen/teichoic acid export membrane protein